jgi:sugar phosphate isomerase/epimerase
MSVFWCASNKIFKPRADVCLADLGVKYPQRMKISCQTQLLLGTSTLERWRMAERLGFDAIELQGLDAAHLETDHQDWLAAKKAGAVVSSICLSGAPFIGSFVALQRTAAVQRLTRLLECAAELEARGVVTPAAWGIFSTRLPPHIPPRSSAEDRQVLLEALGVLGAVAASLGVQVFFEPLNRYEDHMVNTLAQGASLLSELGLPSLRLLADTYHMNIEEANPVQALHDHASWLGQVHLSDSNRLEPGQGHLDFAKLFASLEQAGFAGYGALECRLSGEPEMALANSLAWLRGAA